MTDCECKNLWCDICYNKQCENTKISRHRLDICGVYKKCSQCNAFLLSSCLVQNMCNNCITIMRNKIRMLWILRQPNITKIPKVLVKNKLISCYDESIL